MTTAVYPKALEAFLAGTIVVASATIKVVLVDNTYTYSAAHQFLSSLGAHTVGTAVALTSKTVVGGTVDAADVVFASVPIGHNLGGYAVYKDTGSSATSPLIAFCSQNVDGTPIALATDGGDINMTLDTRGLFSI